MVYCVMERVGTGELKKSVSFLLLLVTPKGTWTARPRATDLWSWTVFLSYLLCAKVPKTMTPEWPHWGEDAPETPWEWDFGDARGRRWLFTLVSAPWWHRGPQRRMGLLGAWAKELLRLNCGGGGHNIRQSILSQPLPPPCFEAGPKAPSLPD